MADLKDIQGIIWDLDNTLYRFNDLFVHACNVAAARTICTLVDNFTYEEALAEAEKSYEEHGYSGHAFVTRHGVPYHDYHFPFHEAIDEKILDRNDDMLSALADLNLPHVIVTNASRHWAEKSLLHLGMKDFFPDENIIALEDTDFEPKARSVLPFEMARDKLRTDPAGTLVIEDTVRNLRVPKQMGFRTALVHHGKTPDVSEDFIDLEFPDTLSVLEALRA